MKKNTTKQSAVLLETLYRVLDVLARYTILSAATARYVSQFKVSLVAQDAASDTH